jgi:quercetin dioxygenase-like cupin family protein
MKGVNEESVLTELDGVLAAPAHHKIVFENEQFRVVDFYVPPGDTVATHTHRWPTVNYVIRHSDFLSFDAEGNLKMDSRSAQAEVKAGEVFCLPAFPALHSVKNVGDGPIHGVAIEIKNGSLS